MKTSHVAIASLIVLGGGVAGYLFLTAKPEQAAQKAAPPPAEVTDPALAAMIKKRQSFLVAGQHRP